MHQTSQLVWLVCSQGLITWRISAWAEISTLLTRLKFCYDYMTNFSPGWNISLRAKYEIASKESRENQAAILFPAFQRGLKILAQFNQTRLGFSARAELHPGLNSSPRNRQFDFKSRVGISARLNSSCNQAFTRISNYSSFFYPLLSQTRH